MEKKTKKVQENLCNLTHKKDMAQTCLGIKAQITLQMNFWKYQYWGILWMNSMQKSLSTKNIFHLPSSSEILNV